VSYTRPKNNRTVTWAIILIACASAAGVGYVLVRKLKQRQAGDHDENQHVPGTEKTKMVMKRNSIYLFGDFMVRDRKNRDITYLFSAKLKQVFCVILQYSTEDGITSQRLSDILWPDKPASKVKNSRGVTINHLRKVLGELDGIELIYEKGSFRFVQTAEFYCDYTRCIEIISSTNGLEEYREELIEILNRGKFLKLTEDSSFDTFKEATEQKLEPVLLLEMEKSFAAESYQATIDLAELVFNIDPLNDTALAFQIKAMQKLKLNEEARIRYQAFVIEYKKIIGNDYPHHLKV
jgi:two-component SAPR family response regulator